MNYQSVYRPGLFDNRRIIVTGGGSGIGRCTAHELSSLGAWVALVGRKPEKLTAVADEIEKLYGRRPTCHVCDIRDEAQVTAVVASVLESGLPIHGLVNNAGGQFRAPLEEISANGFDAVVRNNLTGGFLMARECFRQSMREHGGSVVNILADMWRSMPGMAHSGAARAGMLNLTQTAAVEWARAGVRVNAVAPGYIASSGLANYPEKDRAYIANSRNWVPLKRFGTEAEISAAIVFLLSEAAAFISGSCIRVDGAAPNARQDWSLPDHRQSHAYHGFPDETRLDFLEPKDMGS